MPQFDEEEIAFIKTLGIKADFSNLIDDDCIEIEERVGNAYISEEATHPDSWSEILFLCEGILEKLE